VFDAAASEPVARSLLQVQVKGCKKKFWPTNCLEWPGDCRQTRAIDGVRFDVRSASLIGPVADALEGRSVIVAVIRTCATTRLCLQVRLIRNARWVRARSPRLIGRMKSTPGSDSLACPTARAVRRELHRFLRLCDLTIKIEFERNPQVIFHIDVTGTTGIIFTLGYSREDLDYVERSPGSGRFRWNVL
jgi:hypothetical protein